MMASEPTGSDPKWVSLKSRIKQHYDVCSSYYNSLWGEHIHHGYFAPENPSISKEEAQLKLIELMLSRAELKDGSRVLDVGCGLGGTSRYLAREHKCDVTGVTISSEQVKMATQMSKGLIANDDAKSSASNEGKVKFLELDAEKLGEHLKDSGDPGFNAVWITEALSHFPNKKLFFENAIAAIRRNKNGNGKLVLADWFKNEGLSAEEFESDIRPIEHGMLLPPLCTQNEYVQYAQQAGFKTFAEPLDISSQVARTWDISVGLVANPSLWALAFSQGKDFVAFLRAFNAMRNGYRNGTFRYAIMVFEIS